MTQTLAYLYRLTELSTNKWYVGSRTRKNCHPNDGYICSSKIVKPLYKANPSNWTRQILVIGNPSDIRKLESDYLKSLDAASDSMSYNLSNGDGKWTTAGLFGELNPFYGRTHGPEMREYLSKKAIGRTPSNKGMKMPQTSESLRKNALINPNYGRKGKPHTEETKNKISESNKGKFVSEETRNKLASIKRTDEWIEKQRATLKAIGHSKGEKNPMFGKKKAEVSCPHCNVVMDVANAKRYHFDNCKHKGNK